MRAPLNNIFLWLTYFFFWGALCHFIWAFYQVSDFSISYVQHVKPDFLWFYFSFRDILLHGGQTLYNAGAQHAWLHRHDITKIGLNIYAYPPLFAVIFSPIGLLPLKWAFWTWNLLSAAAYTAMVVLISRWATRLKMNQLILISLGLLFYPLFENFYMGQVDIFLSFLVALGFYLIYGKEKNSTGGALIALAACIKVTPAIFIVFWLIQRKWRIIKGASIMVVGSIILTSLLVPMNLYSYYIFHTLSQVNAVDFRYGGAPWNGSFKGILMATRFKSLAPISAWVFGFGVPIAFLVYFKNKNPNNTMT